MKKTVLTLAASAAIVFSAVQFAAASEHHRATARHHAYSDYRNSNAYFAPAYTPVEPEWYRYSGGWSDLAGH